MDYGLLSNIISEGSASHHWVPQDLKNLTDKIKKALSTINSNLPSADNLINSCKEKPDVSYVMLIHETGKYVYITFFVVDTQLPSLNISISIRIVAKLLVNLFMII